MVPQMHLNLVGMAKTDNLAHKWFNLCFSLSIFPGKIVFSSYDSRSTAQFLRGLTWTNRRRLSFTKTCPIEENFSELSLSLLKPKQTKNKQTKESFSNGA